MTLPLKDLEELARTKTVLLKDFFQAEPPSTKGEDLVELWRQIYDEEVKNTVVKTAQGPSDDLSNPVFPYEKLQAIVGDGGHWKWPRIWRRFDELERRGTAFRPGDAVNFDLPNSNPNITSQKILVVGGQGDSCHHSFNKFCCNGPNRHFHFEDLKYVKFPSPKSFVSC